MIVRQLDDLRDRETRASSRARSCPTRYGPWKSSNVAVPPRSRNSRRIGDVAVGQPQVARLDEVDPRVAEEPRIVERQHDRILDLDDGRGLEAARQVLLGRRARRCTTARRRSPAAIARAFGDVVILDADEAPLQAGEAVVGARLAAARRARRRAERGSAAPASSADGGEPTARRAFTAAPPPASAAGPARARSSARSRAPPASAFRASARLPALK